MQEKVPGRHRTAIVEQFTQQAVPFAKVPGHHDALDLLVHLAQPTAEDVVLDVACGPGLVACEFARHCARVTGLDITPAMIEQARQRQQEAGLDNLTWEASEALPLPYSDSRFTLVVTRYSLHHFLEPEAIVAEMVRVCAPGGRVLIADVAVEPEKSAGYDRLERFRDPSHTHALTTEEFEALSRTTGLLDCRQAAYGVEIEMENQLRASFPGPGGRQRLREQIIADIGVNRLGISARREKNTVVYTVPIRVLVGCKRSAS